MQICNRGFRSLFIYSDFNLTLQRISVKLSDVQTFLKEDNLYVEIKCSLHYYKSKYKLTYLEIGSGIEFYLFLNLQ